MRLARDLIRQFFWKWNHQNISDWQHTVVPVFKYQKSAISLHPTEYAFSVLKADLEQDQLVKSGPDSCTHLTDGLNKTQQYLI